LVILVGRSRFYRIWVFFIAKYYYHVMYLVGSNGPCLQFYDPVYCDTTSPNCTVYINQTIKFVCECTYKNCTTIWISNNATNVRTNSMEYDINVTDSIAGIMTCVENSNGHMYNWTVTILKPSKCYSKHTLCWLQFYNIHM